MQTSRLHSIVEISGPAYSPHDYTGKAPTFPIGEDPLRQSLWDQLANKVDLTIDDIRLLKELPIFRDEKSITWDIAARVQRAPQYCRFLKFERLNLMILYTLQHKLLSLDQRSTSADASGALQSPGESSSSRPSLFPATNPFSSENHSTVTTSTTAGPAEGFVGDLDEIQRLLQEYNEALKTFREMQAWPEASTRSCEVARSDFAFHFRDEKYLTSAEKMFDLNPSVNTRTGNSMDWVRRVLVNRLPLRFVNKDEYNMRLVTTSKPGAPPQRVMTASSRKAVGETPGFVDNLARVLVSATAGLFLLVPMIALSFVNSQKVRLGVTVAFVLVFSLALGLSSKATNDAVMGATAAYAAVLVVFVGQTTPIN